MQETRCHILSQSTICSCAPLQSLLWPAFFCFYKKQSLHWHCLSLTCSLKQGPLQSQITAEIFCTVPGGSDAKEYMSQESALQLNYLPTLWNALFYHRSPFRRMKGHCLSEGQKHPCDILVLRKGIRHNTVICCVSQSNFSQLLSLLGYYLLVLSILLLVPKLKRVLEEKELWFNCTSPRMSVEWELKDTLLFLCWWFSSPARKGRQEKRFKFLSHMKHAESSLVRSHKPQIWKHQKNTRYLYVKHYKLS